MHVHHKLKQTTTDNKSQPIPTQARISLRRIERFLERRERPGRRALPPPSAPVPAAAAAAAAAAARVVEGVFGYAYAPSSSSSSSASSPPAAGAAGAGAAGANSGDGSSSLSSLEAPLLAPASPEERGAAAVSMAAVLRDVELVVPEGELTVVYGPTGAC